VSQDLLDHRPLEDGRDENQVIRWAKFESFRAHHVRLVQRASSRSPFVLTASFQDHTLARFASIDVTPTQQLIGASAQRLRACVLVGAIV
jgi:hypothetical protein